MFDEVVYPTSGYSYLTTGDYRMNPEHPPLLKLWTGLAWLGTGLSAGAMAGWDERDEWRFGRAMLYQGPVPAAGLLLRARAMVVLLSGLLAAGVFAVAWKLGGPGAALGAMALYAFDPVVVAHAGLATTDLGGAVFYFLAAVSLPGALIEGGALRILGSGALTGLALATKFSTLPLLGVVAVLGLVLPALAGGSAFAGRPIGRAAAVVVVAAVTLGASYGPAGPAKYFEGLGILMQHGKLGHPAYAFGRYSETGWWWFFPAAWAIKTPIPILAASAAGVVLLCAGLRRARTRVASIALLLPPLALGSIAMAATINLGVRHLLPVTPFLAVAGGLALRRLAARGGRAGRGVVLLAIVWLAAGTLLVHPDELAYSNEAIGGTEQTWRYLADSNVDWGQDLPALARVVRAQPLGRLYLAYFGTADPAAHGLAYHWAPSGGLAEARFEDGPDPGGKEWIAISVTDLLGVYLERDVYAWLRERPFTAFPGRSIALYDITADAQAHWRLARSVIEFGEAWAAEPALRRALELEPRHPEARRDLLRILVPAGRVEEATRECGRSVSPASDAAVQELCAALGAAPQ